LAHRTAELSSREPSPSFVAAMPSSKDANFDINRETRSFVRSSTIAHETGPTRKMLGAEPIGCRYLCVRP
jgi:hypothetical protein